MARTIDYCYVSLYRGTLSLRLWRRLTMVFCETSVTEDTTNELWWRFYANNSSFLRELLLRIVFQDWFVDDGIFLPNLWQLWPPFFDERLLKTISNVCSKSFCWSVSVDHCAKTSEIKFQDMSFELEEKVPFLISYIGHQNPFQLPIVPSCYYHQPLQTQPRLGPNHQSNQYLSLILELYKSPSVLLFEDY